MSQVLGTVSHGEKIVVKDVHINLPPTGIPASSTVHHGSFVVPADSTPPPPGTTCRLVVADGRSGDIILSASSTGARCWLVHFAINGLFA
jgi:hypothetical protein